MTEKTSVTLAASWVTILLAVHLFSATPAQGATASAAAPGSSKHDQEPATPVDAVVAQVLQMLRDGIAEPVVVLWLEKSGARPAVVTSGDLIALHKAGASNELLKKLVELAGGSAPAVPVAPEAAPANPPAAPAIAPPIPVAPPAAAVPPPPAAGVGAPVKLHFSISYRPVFVEEEQPWTLCLYVDGRFVVAVKPGPVLIPLPARKLDLELAPGKHLLRVAQERHLPYSRARGYSSSSRIDPSDFPFELAPGKAAEIDIHFGERSIRHPGPVAMRLKEDGKEVAQLEPSQTNPETWPALCEDVTASLPSGAKPPATARRELEHCVHWADLWPGVTSLPTRDEVRAEIERRNHPSGG